MARIAFPTDLHLGDPTHDESGIRRQVADRMVDDILKVAQYGDIDAIVIPGDIYHSVKPAPWAYRVIARLVGECRKLSVPVILLDGNHDRAHIGSDGPHDVPVSGHKVPHYTRIDTLLVDDIELLMVPWLSRARIAAMHPEIPANMQYSAMADLVGAAVQDAVKKRTPGKRLIAVTHFTISGASYNTDVQPRLGESGDLMLPQSVFDGCDLVISGHIHKPQVLDGGRIIYPGAACRHDFGEENQPVEMLVVDGALNTERYPLAALEFCTVPVDVNAKIPDVMNKVVRLKGEMPAGPETAAFIATIERDLLAAGALKIAKHAITTPRHEHRTVSSIRVDTNLDDALRQYADVVGGDYAANLPELLALQSELMGDE